nr:ubiquitin-conjugating enzyme family protein [Candidatus Sigynarchaeota archaeon]
MREEIDYERIVEAFKLNDYVQIGALGDFTFSGPFPNRSFQVVVEGKEGTPFEGGSFTFTIYITLEYPEYPPVVHCNTPMWHPLIDEKEDRRYNVQLGIFLDQKPLASNSGVRPFGWNQERTLTDVIQSIVGLVHMVPPYWTSLDSLNEDALEQLWHDYHAFDAKAREWTERFGKK